MSFAKYSKYSGTGFTMCSWLMLSIGLCDQIDQVWMYLSLTQPKKQRLLIVFFLVNVIDSAWSQSDHIKQRPLKVFFNNIIK